MTTQVLHKHFRLETAGAYADAANTDPSRFGLQKGNRSLRRSRQLLRQCRNIQILAITIQHSLHKKIRRDKNVAMHSRARHAKNCGNGHRLVYFGHVARLASTLVGIVAVQPFQIWHLFRK